MSFRLLNSEIGNDLIINERNRNKIESFRLLNSEIGNDHRLDISRAELAKMRFRLLNSEIGNDRWLKNWKHAKNASEFSSP